MHITIPRKIPKLTQLYPEYIIIFIIKILGSFWGVTWGVASLGFTLLGVAHPIRDNISGAGLALIDGFHPGL